MELLLFFFFPNFFFLSKISLFNNFVIYLFKKIIPCAFLNEFINLAPSFVATGTGPGVLNPSLAAAAQALKGALDSGDNLSEIGRTK